MAQAQFIPSNSFGAIAGGAESGLNMSLSLMERSQMMKLRSERAKLEQEEAERARQQHQVLMPVMQAESEARVYAAQAGIANSVKSARLMSQLAQESEAAEDEWLGVMQLQDPQAQARAATEWTGRWMKYSALKDFSPLWEQRKELAGKFLQHAMDLRKIDMEFSGKRDLEQLKLDNAGPESPLGKMIADLNRAQAAGNASEAAYLKAGIEADITPKGMRLEVGKDGSFILAQGAQNGLTTTGTTRSEQSQFDAERAMREGASLLTSLRPQDLGIKGVVQEDIINKGLAQIRPELADTTTSENRTKLRTWREGTMRLISADTRFSNADRAAIERLLPQDGAFESMPSAQAKILAVINIMHERAKKEAERRGTESYLGSPDSIKAAVKDGRLEAPVAVELVKSLFPGFTPTKEQQ